MAIHTLAPVVLFVYNRPIHTQRTITSLVNCQLASASEIFIFSDAARSTADEEQVRQVRQYIQTVTGFKNKMVIERPTNMGLARSVIDGVSQVMSRYGKAIILEDDMVFAEDFLVFLNESLEVYKDNPSVFSISGYSYPITIPDSYTKDVYLLPRASSWGWATWADRWQKADWQVTDYRVFLKDKTIQDGFAQGGRDLVYMLIKQQKGLVNSWAVRWSYTHYKHQAYCLFPRISKLQNIGNDESGTHSPKTKRFETILSNKSMVLDRDLVPNDEIIKGLQHFFQPSLVRQLINYFKLQLWK
ncbi:glycosyltransferase [Cytophagaceae bacterium YF14B1]|uniref:Glycosyltransferase n=1 Tax=Xanthocytophaga flava TaxID=3048013 RepID=A0AAE3QLK3_9BACT|nr:glycosyltransferase [Xanthocytophaga flavus]MDJ1481552.1 glycosyltransferase [Xanthocytophaga flavus]